MISDMKYYIKERHNPQFDKPYYQLCGRLTKKDAKRKESSLYGDNYMLEFNTKESYENAAQEFEKNGFKVYK